MRLVVTGFTGPYTLPDDISSKTDHIVHVCAGSGSVPNFSMLKFALAHHPGLRHTLVYSNKMWADVIFRDELDELAAATSRPPGGRPQPDARGESGGVRTERAEGAHRPAAAARDDPRADGCYVYVCGPGISKFDIAAAKEAGTEPQPRFLETVLADLKTLGVPNDRIKREFYG